MPRPPTRGLSAPTRRCVAGPAVHRSDFLVFNCDIQSFCGIQPWRCAFNILINSTFNTVRPSTLLAQAQGIVTAMTGNPSFPEPWSSGVPSLAQLQTDLTAFQNAVTATAAGDRTRIVERNTTRAKLANDLGLLGFYVQGIANGNAEMLATTGFPFRQRTPRSQALDVPIAPAGVRASCGLVSGTMVIRSRRVSGAGSYGLQLTSADPTVESNWATVGSYKNCNRIELTDLAPLKTYSVRLRALGAAGQGAWSVPVSLLVV
jgi:hypothetical protein